MKQNTARAKHTSGSPSAWNERRSEYRLASGAVSNPGDGRMRKKERRLAARYAFRWKESP